MDTKTAFFWLIEYQAARPYAIYIADCKAFPVCDPHQAVTFETRAEAQRYMHEHGLANPWHEVQHGFID